MPSRPLAPPEHPEAGGLPRKLSVKLLPPRPAGGPSPGRAPQARARTHGTHSPPQPLAGFSRLLVPTTFSSCSGRSPGVLRGRPTGARGTESGALGAAGSRCEPRARAAGHRPGRREAGAGRGELAPRLRFRGGTVTAAAPRENAPRGKD